MRNGTGIALAMAIGSSLLLLGAPLQTQTPPQPDPVPTKHVEMQESHPSVHPAYERSMAKILVTRQMMDGERTILEVVAIFRALDHAGPTPRVGNLASLTVSTYLRELLETVESVSTPWELKEKGEFDPCVHCYRMEMEELLQARGGITLPQIPSEVVAQVMTTTRNEIRSESGHRAFWNE